MAILITGGKGFVGSNLARFLALAGYEVVKFEGDISDEKVTGSFKTDKKISAVIHMAAVTNKGDKKVFQKVNVGGTKNIIKLCRRIGAERIIFLSSIRVLASSDNPYVCSKREAENLVIASGLPYVIIRPSMIYGPGNEKNMGFLLKMIKKLPVVPVLSFRMQPFFIDDVVKIIAACLNAPENSIFNVTGMETFSFYEVLVKLQNAGYKFKIIDAPDFFFAVIWLLSFLPFSPLPHWQVKGLLSDEVFESVDWPKLFDIKPTPFQII